MPLYAFLWVFFGYGAIAMLNSRLLLPAMKPWLPLVDEYGDFILTEEGEKQTAAGENLPGGTEGSRAAGLYRSDPDAADEDRAAQKTLEDMERLGM